MGLGLARRIGGLHNTGGINWLRHGFSSCVTVRSPDMGVWLAGEILERPDIAMQHLPVYWYEGLFLRPQHFQALERSWTEWNQTAHQWDFPFHYGLRALEFSSEATRQRPFRSPPTARADA